MKGHRHLHRIIITTGTTTIIIITWRLLRRMIAGVRFQAVSALVRVSHRANLALNSIDRQEGTSYMAGKPGGRSIAGSFHFAR